MCGDKIIIDAIIRVIDVLDDMLFYEQDYYNNNGRIKLEDIKSELRKAAPVKTKSKSCSECQAFEFCIKTAEVGHYGISPCDKWKRGKTCQCIGEEKSARRENIFVAFVNVLMGAVNVGTRKPKENWRGKKLKTEL
jgi:hypothetical protein